MLIKQVIDSDTIVLHSVESYLRSINCETSNLTAEETLALTSSVRDMFYSDISPRAPRLLSYALDQPDDCDIAKGIINAYDKHLMDPVFVQILVEYLEKTNDMEEKGFIGSYIAKKISKYLDSEMARVKNKKSITKVKPVKKKKNDEEDEIVEDVISEENTKPNVEPIQHLQKAVMQLLKGHTALVLTRVPELTDVQALTVAACVSMNSIETIRELIASDLPITAEVLEMVYDKTPIINAVLTLSSDEYLPNTMTDNQNKFLDSLKRWVYNKLENIPTTTCYGYLVAAYGNISIDSNNYWLKVKECGNQYPHLLQVAKMLCN